MHKYHAHAYIVDSTNTNVLYDLGDYYIIIMGYSGGAISGVNEATYVGALEQYLEDYSKFGGSVLAPTGFASVNYIYAGVYPALEPIYCTIASSERYGKVKLVFDSGDYILSASDLSATSVNTSGDAYASDGDFLYANIRYPGLVNGLYPASATDGSPVFIAVNPSKITENGFDTSSYIKQYEFYLSYAPGSTASCYVSTRNNTDFFRFLNRQVPQPVGFNVTYNLIGCTGDASNPSIIPPNATVTVMQFNIDNEYTFNSGSVWIDGDGFPSGTPIVYTFDTESGELRVGPITSDITIHVHAYIDPYNNPDNPDLIDGETDIPNADTISVPSLPGIGAVSSGMIGLFNPSASQMQLLADYMWTDFGGTGNTTEDILKEIVQAIKRSISNPLDYVIGLNIIPSQGLSVGSSTSVRFGFVNSNVSMPRLTSQYFTVDCGSLSFDKLCGDTFLDYAPYSKFSLYLPYIGVKEMDANDFVGHTISILYHGDVVTGGVTAYILKDGSVMYQYSGCCALTVPLNADSWGTTISGAIQIATTLIGGAALSSAGGGFAAKRSGVMAATGAANIASNPSLLSPQVMRSGAISGGAGCMASQKPFVIREAARFHTTEGFNTISGYPSYYYKPLSSMHGFTSVLDAHLHGIPGTHQELAEIEDLLKEGVIL